MSCKWFGRGQFRKTRPKARGINSPSLHSVKGWIFLVITGELPTFITIFILFMLPVWASKKLRSKYYSPSDHWSPSYYLVESHLCIHVAVHANLYVPVCRMLICVLCLETWIPAAQHVEEEGATSWDLGENGEQCDECSCLPDVLLYSWRRNCWDKGRDFFGACRFEKCFLRCFAVVEQKELPMVVVSKYTDGTSVFRY